MTGSARRNVVLSFGSRCALPPLALLAATAARAGDPLYLVETALAAGTQQIERAAHIDVGLFAGDARTDLLVIAADASGRRVAQVWEQIDPGPNGAFHLRQVLTMPGSVVDVLPTDLDRDGGEDIVVLTDDAEDSLGVFVQQSASPTSDPYVRNAQRFALPSKTALGRLPAGSGPTFEYRIVVGGDGTSPALMFRPDGAQGLIEMPQSFPRPGGTRVVFVVDADGDNALDFMLMGPHPQRLWLSRPGGYVEQVLTVGLGTVVKVLSSSGDPTGDGRVDPIIVDDMGRVIRTVALPPATPGSGQDYLVTSIIDATPMPAVDAMLFDVTDTGDPALLIARPGTAGTPGSLDVHLPLPGGGLNFQSAVHQRFTGSYAALQFGSAKTSDGYVTAFAATLANGLRTYRVGTAAGVSTITATLEREINPRVVEITAATMYVEMTLRADPPVSRRVEVPIVDTIAFDGPPRNSVAVFEPGASTAVWQSNVEVRWRTAPTWQIGAVSDPDIAIGTTAPLTLILPPSLYAGFGSNVRACTSCAVAEFGDAACPPSSGGLNLPNFPPIPPPASSGAPAKTISISEIDTLRAFRDEVLLDSSKGQDYVAWYYQYSPEIVAALVRRPTLALDIADTKTTLWPFVASLADGDGSVPLSNDMAAAVRQLADRSKLLVSDEFRERIETELDVLDLESRVGQTGVQVKAGIEGLPGRTIARIGFE